MPNANSVALSPNGTQKTHSLSFFNFFIGNRFRVSPGLPAIYRLSEVDIIVDVNITNMRQVIHINKMPVLV